MNNNQPSIWIMVVSIGIIMTSFMAFMHPFINNNNMLYSSNVWYSYRWFCSIFYFVAAIFLLFLKNWDRNLIITVSLMTIFITLLVALRDMQFNIGLLGLAGEVFFIYFFTRSKVKGQFKWLLVMKLVVEREEIYSL